MGEVLATETETIRISSKYQVVIPKSIRERVGINKGDDLAVSVQGNEIILKVKPNNFTDHMLGLHREVWGDVDAAEYVDGERTSWEPKPEE